jgi:hypothetical protein
VWIHVSRLLHVVAVSGQQHALQPPPPPGERALYTYQRAVWMGPRSGPDDMEKSQTRDPRDSNLEPLNRYIDCATVARTTSIIMYENFMNSVESLLTYFERINYFLVYL